MTMISRGWSGLMLASAAVAVALCSPSRVVAQHHHHYVNPSYHYHDSYNHGHYHQNYYAQDQHYHVYSSPITYAARTHLDTLASDLKYAANRVAWDMYENYTANPGYRETYREAYKMLQDAKHIYTLVYDEQYHLHQHPGGVDHIATDLRDILALYQHIQQDIARWSPTIYNPYHDAGLLHAKMQKFGEVLNHILADYGIPAPVAGAPAAPSASLDPPTPQYAPGTASYAPVAPSYSAPQPGAPGYAPAAPVYATPQPNAPTQPYTAPPGVIPPSSPAVAP